MCEIKSCVDCQNRAQGCHAHCRHYKIAKMMWMLEVKKQEKTADVAKFMAAERRVISTRAKKYQKRR